MTTWLGVAGALLISVVAALLTARSAQWDGWVIFFAGVGALGFLAAVTRATQIRESKNLLVSVAVAAEKRGVVDGGAGAAAAKPARESAKKAKKQTPPPSAPTAPTVAQTMTNSPGGIQANGDVHITVVKPEDNLINGEPARPIFWGIGNETEEKPAEFIASLSNSVLPTRNGREAEFFYTTPREAYWYIAHEEFLGSAAVASNGMFGAFAYVAHNIEVKDKAGHLRTYALIRSDNRLYKTVDMPMLLKFHTPTKQ